MNGCGMMGVQIPSPGGAGAKIFAVDQYLLMRLIRNNIY